MLVRYWYTLHTFIALIYQTEHYNSFYNEFLEFDILTKTIEMYFNLGDVKAHNYICKKSLSCISKMCHIWMLHLNLKVKTITAMGTTTPPLYSLLSPSSLTSTPSPKFHFEHLLSLRYVWENLHSLFYLIFIKNIWNWQGYHQFT